MDKEFCFDKKIFNQFYNYKINVDKIYFYFNSGYFKDGVIVVEGNWVIINFEELVD